MSELDRKGVLKGAMGLVLTFLIPKNVLQAMPKPEFDVLTSDEPKDVKYIGLYSGPREVNYSSYARQALVAGDDLREGRMITFPTCSGGTTFINRMAIVDEVGHVLIDCDVDGKQISDGDTVSVNVKLQVT